jgi:hypothetical protein
MARIVLVLGESGTGKSRSLTNLNPEETFLINIIGKDLPFRGFAGKYKTYNKATGQGNMIKTHNADTIVKAFDVIQNLGKFKTIIVDDFQYVMSYEFMERAKEVGFSKFTEIGQNAWKIFRAAENCKVENVFFLAHSEDIFVDGIRKTKMKTIGKLLDEKITPEGLFTIVLNTEIEKTETGVRYWFVTQNDGTTTAKSPEGMFQQRIPNDLQLVIESINNYNEG